MSKQPPPAPTASAVGPCPTVIQIVGRPGTGSLPSTFAPPDHPLVFRKASIWKHLLTMPRRYFCCGSSILRRALTVCVWFPLIWSSYLQLCLSICVKLIQSNPSFHHQNRTGKKNKVCYSFLFGFDGGMKDWSFVLLSIFGFDGGMKD